MKKMKIDIWSDIACPFCYIGLRKLEDSLAKFGHEDQIEIVWHSYELNSSLPMKAIDKSYYEYLAEMQDISPIEAKEKTAPIVASAKELGLNYQFDKAVPANTSKALRLVKLAAKQGLSTKAEEVLFKAYFEEGKNVSSHDILINLGTGIGLKESDIKQMLEKNSFAEEVVNDTKYAEEELNLEFIPYFLFNNKNAIQGAVSKEEFYSTLEKSFTEWTENGESKERGNAISGQSCSIDGVCS